MKDKVEDTQQNAQNDANQLKNGLIGFITVELNKWLLINQYFY